MGLRLIVCLLCLFINAHGVSGAGAKTSLIQEQKALQFGFPQLIRLSDGDVLVVFWGHEAAAAADGEAQAEAEATHGQHEGEGEQEGEGLSLVRSFRLRLALT